MRGALTLLLAVASALSLARGSSFHVTVSKLSRLKKVASSAADASTCSLPANTLSFSCDDACAPYSPCLTTSPSPSRTATKANASVSSSCAYKCFQMSTSSPQSYQEFVFLIPYSTWKSAQEVAGNFSPEAANAKNDTKRYPSESNALLQRIDTLRLPNQTTTVKIQGGSSLVSDKVKARVANVALAPDLLATQSQVRAVHLINLNLALVVDIVSDMLPPDVVTIKLNNGLLDHFPPGMSKFKNLTTLNLNRNFITQVNSSMGLESVASLGLNSNSLRTFDAVFPNLTVLDLAVNNLSAFPFVLAKYPRLETIVMDTNIIPAIEEAHAIPSLKELYLNLNVIDRFEAHFPNLTTLRLGRSKLTAIPPVIFKHKKLTELILTGSLISNVTITQAQAEFLGNLTVFKFDAAGLFRDCPLSQRRTVHNLRFCLSDVREDIPKVDAASSSSNNAIGGVIVDSSHNSKEGTRGGLSQSTMTTIIVVVICVTLMLLIGIVVVYRIKTAALRHVDDDDDQSELEQSMSATETYPSTGDTIMTSNPHNSNSNRAVPGVALASIWEDVGLLGVQVDVDAIFDLHELSEGSNVWLVRYQGTRLLASRRLKKIANTNTPAEKQAHRERTRGIISEIKLASQLTNDKIVKFIGATWTIEADLQTLYEFMDGGDLRTFLADERTPCTWSLQKIQIAIDIAEALVYCHNSFSPPLVHGALSPRNVLLSMRGDAKLKNVGISRFKSSSQRAVSSARWLAPEIVTGANSSDYGPAADIFALGVVLCELDTHRVPYQVDVDAQSFTEVALLQLVATGELKPRLSASCPREIADLALRCLDLNPEARPTAAELTYELRVFKKSLGG